MNYAVPRILDASGLLERLYTDGVYPRGLSRIPVHLRPGILRRLDRRETKGITANRVTSFPWFGVRYALYQRRLRDQPLEAYLWSGREFCRRIIRSGLYGCGMVYAFNSAALELMRHAHLSGRLCVLEQTIAAKRFERRLIDEELALWPGWETRSRDKKQLETDYGDREASEWQESDLIICGSAFVARSIAETGGPSKRCVVVPYGVDLEYSNEAERAPVNRRVLNVLFLGRVGLRKGAPYFAECARLLNSRAFHFRAAGQSDLSSEFSSAFACHIDVAGAVSRSEVAELYRWADVLVLPTLCEGSATVCYEALAAGVPVITTPNAGSVVRDGIEGFIVPIRRPDLMSEKLELLARDRDRLRSLSRNAVERALDHTIARYGKRLLYALGGLLGDPGGHESDRVFT